jgi:hypothetical protein
MLSYVILNVVMLSFVMPKVGMLSFIMLNVVMLNVVPPFRRNLRKIWRNINHNI